MLQDDRQFALKKGLEEINKEIDQAGRMGVACWFPMGNKNERIVRLAAEEAVLLNSRSALFAHKSRAVVKKSMRES